MNISFKNFRRFLSESDFQLRKFNLLIGPNSSGKSTISDLIKNYVDLTTFGIANVSETYLIRNLTDITAIGKRSKKRLSSRKNVKANKQKTGSKFSGGNLRNVIESSNYRAIFPKYYNQFQREWHKKHQSIEEDIRYPYVSRFINDFKFNPKISDQPSSIKFIYGLKAKGVDFRRSDRFFSIRMRRNLLQGLDNRNFDDTGTQLFRTNKENHLYDFGEKINKYLEKIVNNPQKQGGITSHQLEVSFAKNHTSFLVKSKQPFIDGLNISQDLNSQDRIMYFNDGSAIQELINDTSKNLTISVFKNLLNFTEDKFSHYKDCYKELFPNEKMPDYPLTMPLDIDTSKINLKTNKLYDKTMRMMEYVSSQLYFDNAIVKTGESTANLWNISPYISSYSFTKSDLREIGISSIEKNLFPTGFKVPKKISRFGRLGSGHSRIINRYKDNILRLYEFEEDELISPISGNLVRDYIDYDFYQDFALTANTEKPKDIYKKMIPHFNFKKNKAIQPAYGVLFKISSPSVRFGSSTDAVMKRDVVSDIKKVETFLKELGAKKLLNDFDIFSPRYRSGRVSDWIYNPKGVVDNFDKFIREKVENIYSNSVEDCLLNYVQLYRKSLKKCSLFNEPTIENSELQLLAKKYGVRKEALLNQVDIIRLHLLRTMIVRFQKHLNKYLFAYYIEKFEDGLETNFEINLFKDSENRSFFRKKVSPSVTKIKPNNAEFIDLKDDLVVSKDDLIKFFGENSSSLFSPKEVDLSFKRKLNQFNRFINKSLDEIGCNFNINIKNAFFTTEASKSDSSKNLIVRPSSELYEFIVTENNAKTGLFIKERGLGDATIISLLGQLFPFDRVSKRNNEILIIREPEAYLHPNLIDKVIRFLFNFANSENRQNLSIILETHSEVVLRSLQYQVKDLKIADESKVGIFYVDPNLKNKEGTKINDIGINKNGFLKRPISEDFFGINMKLAKHLWDSDEK